MVFSRKNIGKRRVEGLVPEGRRNEVKDIEEQNNERGGYLDDEGEERKDSVTEEGRSASGRKEGRDPGRKADSPRDRR